ncbi:hypothetical protein TNCT_685851 [Trichonephila clavata]|uniref:Uncharacterized protein n=1 Tax=Trichonephila clavata TaxID=2740835 RepID=A0A8X6GH91_TRICU|nr:hypothetical protein TNCT_685851 [Trichonephila clavata]
MRVGIRIKPETESYVVEYVLFGNLWIVVTFLRSKSSWRHNRKNPRARRVADDCRYIYEYKASAWKIFADICKEAQNCYKRIHFISYLVADWKVGIWINCVLKAIRKRVV